MNKGKRDAIDTQEKFALINRMGYHVVEVIFEIHQFSGAVIQHCKADHLVHCHDADLWVDLDTSIRAFDTASFSPFTAVQS